MKKPKINYPVTFRIFPESEKGLFFFVYVWETKKDMHEALASVSEPNFEATCFNYEVVNFWEKDGKRFERKLMQMGEIHFFKDSLGAGLVSHEMTHAAIAWARRKKVDPMKKYEESDRVSSDNERFATAQGKLVREATWGFVKKKIY